MLLTSITLPWHEWKWPAGSERKRISCSWPSEQLSTLFSSLWHKDEFSHPVSGHTQFNNIKSSFVFLSHSLIKFIWIFIYFSILDEDAVGYYSDSQCAVHPHCLWDINLKCYCRSARLKDSNHYSLSICTEAACVPKWR